MIIKEEQENLKKVKARAKRKAKENRKKNSC